MANEALWFLTSPDEHWTENHEAWERDERRLYGGDHVLSELTKFTSEGAESHDLRTRTARYWNIPDRHMSLIAGHLMRAMPEPEWGAMGERRERSKIDVPNLSEICWFNCDGIGADGTQLRTWTDGVIKRAGATGYRGILVEMPRQTTLTDIRRRRDPEAEKADVPLEGESTSTAQPLTQQDRADGWHPYFVEYSPTLWTRRHYTEGTLDMAVLKIKVPTETVAGPGASLEEDGYYLLVREGYDRLGAEFKKGGWWIFNNSLTEVAQGRWTDTRGKIPLVLAMAEHSTGTPDHPMFGRSLTMELGQIAIDMMNARSEQRYNARQAAKSVLFGMGMSSEVQADVATQLLAGSIVVAIPPVDNLDGTKIIPSMFSGSSVALDTSVYSNIIAEAIEEAHQTMVTQVTSAPESSGESKKAGWEEAVSPMLTRSAGALETWLNTALGFYAMRAGVKPDATIEMPEKMQLHNVLSAIDEMIASMKAAMLESPTWTADMLVKQGDELRLLPDTIRKQVEAELALSVKRSGDHGVAAYWTQMSAAVTEMTAIPGMTPQGAGYLLGLSVEQVNVLRTGVPPGEQNDGTNKTPTAEEQAAADAAATKALESANDGQQPDSRPLEPVGQGGTFRSVRARGVAVGAEEEA